MAADNIVAALRVLKEIAADGGRSEEGRWP
jgi:hypothetical protein